MRILHILWLLSLADVALIVAGLWLRLADASLKRGDKLYWKPRRYPTRYLKVGVGAGRLADVFVAWSNKYRLRCDEVMRSG